MHTHTWIRPGVFSLWSAYRPNLCCHHCPNTCLKGNISAEHLWCFNCRLSSVKLNQARSHCKHCCEPYYPELHSIIRCHFVQRGRLRCAARRRLAGRRRQASNSECFACQAPVEPLQLYAPPGLCTYSLTVLLSSFWNMLYNTCPMAISIHYWLKSWHTFCHHLEWLLVRRRNSICNFCSYWERS